MSLLAEANAELGQKLTDSQMRERDAILAVNQKKVEIKDLKWDIRDHKWDIKTHQSTIADLKLKVLGKAAPLSKEDVIQIDNAKAAAKIVVSQAMAMAKVDAVDEGQKRKKERNELRYQEKLSGAGMA